MLDVIAKLGERKLTQNEDATLTLQVFNGGAHPAKSVKANINLYGPSTTMDPPQRFSLN